MKKEARSIIYDVLSLINRVVPKTNRIMVYGDYLYDNNEAMLEYLNSYIRIPIICIADTYRNIKVNKNVKFVKNSIINAIYYSLTSKVIIDSFFHAIRIIPQQKQISIQLWHGTPLKRIDLHKGECNSKYYTHIIYPSEMFREIYKQTFECDVDKLFLCGNPRNDLLFEPQIGPLRIDGIKKYVIWMPTYRHGLGNEDSHIDIPVLTKDNVSLLDRTLQDEEIFLFIKPHPRQMSSFDDMLVGLKNIRLLTDQMLRDANVPLYSFIGNMDALLTDYSSVYFDYLLLDRPIGFVIDDFKEYSDKRGLYFEDPLAMMPGEKIINMDQLCDFFENLDNNKRFKEERKRVNDLVNHYQDDNNRERILRIVQKCIGNNINE